MLRDVVKQNPKLISVLMTTRSDELLKEEVVKAGIRGFLEKPFDLKELEEISEMVGTLEKELSP